MGERLRFYWRRKGDLAYWARRVREFLFRRKCRRFFSRFVRPGTLCFDIGANVGDLTDVFRSLGAKVVAVEPLSECVDVLQRRFSGDESVRIVKKGVDRAEGRRTIHICDEGSPISTMSDKWKTAGRYAAQHTWSTSEQVPVTTLDALIDTYGLPRFCKIDVEGFELNAIKGLSKSVPYLSYEFSMEFLDDARACAAHLKKFGAVSFNFSEGQKLRLWFKTWVSDKELFARLEGRCDPLLVGDVYVRIQ